MRQGKGPRIGGVARKDGPLTIAADGEEIVVVGGKAQARHGQGVGRERRLDFVPLLRFEESDDGVVDGAGFAGGGDEGSVVRRGQGGDLVAVAVEFFALGPERVAGEMVFEGRVREVEGGFVDDGGGVDGVAVVAGGLFDDVVIGEGFDGFVG